MLKWGRNGSDGFAGRFGVTAGDVMRPEPHSVSPDDTLASAAELMGILGTRELPVAIGDRIVGVLTRTDMEPYRGHYEWTPVRAAMTPDPVTVAPDTPVREVAGVLERGFNSVPVTHDGKLVGMIARSDLVRLLARIT
jgi:CBS domain-containing protein